MITRSSWQFIAFRRRNARTSSGISPCKSRGTFGVKRLAAPLGVLSFAPAIPAAGPCGHTGRQQRRDDLASLRRRRARDLPRGPERTLRTGRPRQPGRGRGPPVPAASAPGHRLPGRAAFSSFLLSWFPYLTSRIGVPAPKGANDGSKIHFNHPKCPDAARAKRSRGQ